MGRVSSSDLGNFLPLSFHAQLLACVRPAVRSEVRGLVVPLATAGVVAGVGGQLPSQAVQLCLSLEDVLDSDQVLSHM